MIETREIDLGLHRDTKSGAYGVHDNATGKIIFPYVFHLHDDLKEEIALKTFFEFVLRNSRDNKKGGTTCPIKGQICMEDDDFIYIYVDETLCFKKPAN